MKVWRLLIILLIAIVLDLALAAQESHLVEPGSAPILTRSSFAHGYRHGYEAGYHQGNIDANMGRQPQTKKLRVANTGYLPQFGPRQLFEEGFRLGLEAGYHDGYSGNDFRAVEAMRALATNVEPATAPADSPGDFDHGVSSGYRDGFAHAQGSHNSTATLDYSTVGCDASRPDVFCDGYRRGFVLGRVDALTLRREYILEASK